MVSQAVFVFQKIAPVWFINSSFDLEDIPMKSNSAWFIAVPIGLHFPIDK